MSVWGTFENARQHVEANAKEDALTKANLLVEGAARSFARKLLSGNPFYDGWAYLKREQDRLRQEREGLE